jgi:hypothetical protein
MGNAGADDTEKCASSALEATGEFTLPTASKYENAFKAN